MAALLSQDTLCTHAQNKEKNFQYQVIYLKLFQPCVLYNYFKSSYKIKLHSFIPI